MRLRVFTEPQQGATYDQLLTVARATEIFGFDAFFRSDHYQRIGGGDPGPGPTDAWLTLAAIGRETERIRLGTLVTPVTFRYPGALALEVAQADAMSGGRVEVGLGAGWYDGEHAAYGIPFPATGDRFVMLEEQLEILTAMWTMPAGEQYSFTGQKFRIVDSPALPKPVQQPRPPIILGGWGTKRTPRLAARYADEFNVPFAPVAAYRAACDHVRRACAAIDRDPESIRFSVAQVVCIATNKADYRRRAEASAQDPDAARATVIAGTPDEAIERIHEYAEAGAETVYMQYLTLDDHEHLELIAAEVLPHV